MIGSGAGIARGPRRPPALEIRPAGDVDRGFAFTVRFECVLVMDTDRMLGFDLTVVLRDRMELVGLVFGFSSSEKRD